MGLDLKQFTGEVDGQFICKLCHKVFLDPQVNECGHVFCNSCIKRRVKNGTSKSCVVCSSNLNTETLVPPSTEFRLQLLELEIKCSNKCGRNLPLADLPDHVIEDCPFSAVVCQNNKKGCRKKVRRCDLKRHVDECDFRPVVCEACGHETVFFELFTHQSRTKCLEKKLKQQVIRELRNSQNELKKHWSSLNKMHVKIDVEDRRMKMDLIRAKTGKLTARSEGTCYANGRPEDVENNDVFLTETTVDTISRAKNEEKYRRWSSEANDLLTCKRCKKSFSEAKNNERACRWHAGPIMNVFGGTCFACGRVDYQPGCLFAPHKS